MKMVSIVFENIIDGAYWLEVSVLGFETKKSDTFIVSEAKRSIELNFLLKEETQTFK